jgi:hypothetical protein
MSATTNEHDWPETLATVLSCTYEMRAGRALALGLPSSKHFHITYNYWANDELHTADTYSSKPIPQGSLFPIRYNPDEPRHTHHHDSRPTRSAPDWTPRFALAALIGFFAGLLTLPVACGGFVFANQQRFGDVQSNGPGAVLGGMAVGAIVGIGTTLLIWSKSKPR